VTLDGFFAEAELLGDVAVGAAFDDAADNFHFARGEAEGFAVGDGGLCMSSWRAPTRLTTRRPPIQ